MIDKVEKFLRKLSKKEREVIRVVIARIVNGDVSGLDIKKMKGYRGLYRVRHGDVRVVFSRNEDGFRILSVGRRGGSVYDRL